MTPEEKRKIVDQVTDQIYTEESDAGDLIRFRDALQKIYNLLLGTDFHEEHCALCVRRFAIAQTVLEGGGAE